MLRDDQVARVPKTRIMAAEMEMYDVSQWGAPVIEPGVYPVKLDAMNIICAPADVKYPKGLVGW